MQAGAPTPDGNACVPVDTGTQVTCTGTLSTESSPLTGAAMVMVSGNNLTSFVATMNNYEAVAFGMILP
jgi:hypothetical protein